MYTYTRPSHRFSGETADATEGLGVDRAAREKQRRRQRQQQQQQQQQQQ